MGGWQEYYKGVTMPASEARKFFTQMARGGYVELKVLTGWKKDRHDEDDVPIYAHQLIFIKPVSAATDPTKTDVIVEFTTQGKALPEGMVHGRYKLRFSDILGEFRCDELPTELFKSDEEED